LSANSSLGKIQLKTRDTKRENVKHFCKHLECQSLPVTDNECNIAVDKREVWLILSSCETYYFNKSVQKR